MKTLAQIRAANALQAARIPGIGTGQREGNVLSDFPLLIKTDGSLAAFAYAVEPKADDRDLDQLAQHLAGRRITGSRTARALADELPWLDGPRIAAAGLESENFVRQIPDHRACEKWTHSLREKGLLVTLVTSLRKHGGEFLVVAAIARHLRHTTEEGRIAITEALSPDELVLELATAQDDSKLRRATSEALAFLNYLKRFVA